MSPAMPPTPRRICTIKRATALPISPTARNARRGRRRAHSSEALRNTIETQPYTAVAIALGLGWLLGRLHRPL